MQIAVYLLSEIIFILTQIIFESMEIQEIKQHLTMSAVLQKYNLKPDKNHRLCCPFHEDNTPSMQVYYKTQTAYCFSSNCPTHGKSLDMIDFIMKKENITKHEAILKAQDFIGLPTEQNQNHSPSRNRNPNYHKNKK